MPINHTVLEIVMQFFPMTCLLKMATVSKLVYATVKFLSTDVVQCYRTALPIASVTRQDNQETTMRLLVRPFFLPELQVHLFRSPHRPSWVYQRMPDGFLAPCNIVAISKRLFKGRAGTFEMTWPRDRQGTKLVAQIHFNELQVKTNKHLFVGRRLGVFSYTEVHIPRRMTNHCYTLVVNCQSQIAVWPGRPKRIMHWDTHRWDNKQMRELLLDKYFHSLPKVMEMCYCQTHLGSHEYVWDWMPRDGFSCPLRQP